MKITITRGDVTKIKADAIVNSANSSLLGGGGVDGAIHRAGGPEILEACSAIRNRQGSCATGEAVITTAGKLDAKHVIHTVGPVWNDGKLDEAEKLKRCYQNSLNLAAQHECNTIAFPGISTGIYRFPKRAAAEIAIDTVRAFSSDVVKEVIFVAFDEESYQIYLERLK